MTNKRNKKTTESKQKRRGSQLPTTLREEVLWANPEALLLVEAFDPALIGIVYPVYMDHSDVSVAAYARDKIYEILWERIRHDCPHDDDYTVTEHCSEEYWRVLDFGCGEEELRALLWRQSQKYEISYLFATSIFR